MFASLIERLFLFLKQQYQKIFDGKFLKKSFHRYDQKFFLFQKGVRRPTLRQLWYTKKVLNMKEKKIWGGAKILISLSLFALLANYYVTHFQPAPKPGGEYTEALVGNVQYINPLLSQGNDVDRDLSSLIYSSLLTFRNSTIETDLAENFSLSEDQKTYTFNLRKNVLWHDGEPFNADDVIFTIEKITDPDFKSPLQRTFQGVKTKKINDWSIEITLSEPFAPFLYSLTFGILPAHIWKDIPPRTAYLSEYNLLPIGTGPFRFKSRTIDKKRGIIRAYKLIRNESYYREKPYLNAITFKFFENFQESLNALKQNQVEGMSFLPKNFQEEIQTLDFITNHKLNLAQYTALFFNEKQNSILQEKELRLALAYAMNKNQLIREGLDNQAEIIYGPILPGFIGYNPDIEKFGFDIEKANAILDQAGWKRVEITKYKENRIKEEKENIQKENPADTRSDEELKTEAEKRLQEEFEKLPLFFREKNEKKLELTLSTVENPTNKKVLELIEEDWKRLGIKTKLVFSSPENIKKEVIQPRKYEVFLYAQAVGFDPDPFPFWHSSQNKYPGLNLAIFSNKEVDALLLEARKSNDLQTRELKYRHFQNILSAQIPAIFLYNPVYVYPMSKEIKGFNVASISVPSDRFANVREWYMKTKRIKK